MTTKPITVAAVSEAAFRYAFNSQKMAESFGYNNSSAFRKQVKNQTGVLYQSILQPLRVAKAKQNATPENMSIIDADAEANGINPDDVKYAWVKTDETSLFVVRPEVDMQQVFDNFIEEVKKHKPSYRPIQYKPGAHLMVVDPADIHIGKLATVVGTGQSYDIKTALRRVHEGVTTLLSRSLAFGIDEIIFVIGNDVLHVDNGNSTTTRGTHQDTDGMWDEMIVAAEKMYISIIEQLRKVAPVRVVHCMSNHDNKLGWTVARTVYAWFHDAPGVTFGEDEANISKMDRKYFVYGNSLIGFSHADKAAEGKLASIMAHEAREAWGQVKYGYWILHHVHHTDRKAYGMTPRKREKEAPGVTIISKGLPFDPAFNVYIDYVSSPSAADQWHSDMGYLSNQAIEFHIFSKNHGRVAIISHIF